MTETGIFFYIVLFQLYWHWYQRQVEDYPKTSILFQIIWAPIVMVRRGINTLNKPATSYIFQQHISVKHFLLLHPGSTVTLGTFNNWSLFMLSISSNCVTLCRVTICGPKCILSLSGNIFELYRGKYIKLFILICMYFEIIFPFKCRYNYINCIQILQFIIIY